MAIYARQINPEHQESPFQWCNEAWEDVIFMGNRNNTGRNMEVVETITSRFDDYMAEFEKVGSVSSWYKNVTELIIDMFPPKHKERYTTKDIQAWKRLAALYLDNGEELNSTMIIEGLRLMTGRAYLYDTLRGCSQSEWQDVYIPASYTSATMNALASEWFNTGSEWIVHDEDGEPQSVEDISGCATYCHGWNDEEIAEEIRQDFGKAGDKVVLYKWDGYTKTPKYENVTIG